MSSFQKIEESYLKSLFSRSNEKIDVLEIYKSSDLESLGDNGEGLYHLAAKFFDHEAIDFLSSNNIKARVDEYGNTPFHAMLQSPNFNDVKNISIKENDIYLCVKKLLELKVNPKKKNDMGSNAIFEAGRKNIYPLIKALCESGCEIDVVGEEGKNILHEITTKIVHRKNIDGELDNAVKTIKVLLEHNAIDPEDKDIFDTSAIVYAQRSGIKEIMAAFNGDENLGSSGGMNLAQTVLNKNIEALNDLIQNGASLDEVFDEYGKTALMLACEYPSLEIVKALIKAGADVNFKTGDELSAVYYLITKAIFNLNVDVAGGQKVNTILKIFEVLIDSGLSLDNAIDSHGNTALILLCSHEIERQNNTMIEELLNAGCDINKVNLVGTSALMAFASSGDENKHDIAELLLDNGADVLLCDNNGSTALMYAAMNLNKASGFKIAKLILAKDTSTINKTNNNSQSALDLAIQNNNEPLVKLLLSNM